MERGEIVIVPCTYDANIEATFMLRVFFEKANTAKLVLRDFYQLS